MANPNFTATISSNEVWRDLDDTRCITDDLDAIEADILELNRDKADTDHAHSGYAPSSHGHSYNDLSDKPTIPPAYTHPETHSADIITGLADVATTGNYDDLNGKPTNPPMLPGVEYLTNEYWNGESLYTVLIDCGNFADGTNVDTDIVCRYVVRHCGRIGWSCVPFIHYTLENQYSCWVEVSNFNGRIRVTMQGGASVGSLPVQIQVWYTKPTTNN